MKIRSVCSESFGANTYALISGVHAWIVDPAVSVSPILEVIREEDAVPEGILLTHGHFDHVLSMDTLRSTVRIPAYLHEADAELLSDGKKNAFSLFFGRDRVFEPADGLLHDGQILRIGEEELRVIHTPGHTPGSVCFLFDGGLITGDTLFSQGYGRCDLWGGSPEQMSASLERLSTLPAHLTIYPGHGGSARLDAALDSVAYLF